MADIASWSVRKLRTFLYNTSVAEDVWVGIKEEADLIELAQTIVAKEQQAILIRNSVIVVTLTSIGFFVWYFFRTHLAKLKWINPQWLTGTIMFTLFWSMEKILSINIVLNWILPPTLQQYNYIDLFLEAIQPFPLMIPLGFDSKTGEASAWLDLYPMCLIWLTRQLENIWIEKCGRPIFMTKYREEYYTTNPGSLSHELQEKVANMNPDAQVPSEESSESLSSILEDDEQSNHVPSSFDDMMQRLDMAYETEVKTSPRAAVTPEIKRKLSIEQPPHALKEFVLSPVKESVDEIDMFGEDDFEDLD